MSGNSSLIGVALIVRSKNGPQFVFHYPPHLRPKESKVFQYGTEIDHTSPEASENEGHSDDGNLEDDLPRFQSMSDAGLKSRYTQSWDGDEHYDSIDGVQIVPWEHLGPYSTKDLASILTPHRFYHKRFFELTLESIHFVTYPMHIREDGHWKKKKKPKRPKKKNQSISAEDESTVDNSEIQIFEEPAENAGMDAAHAVVGTEKAEDDGREGPENDSDDGGMTMFNMVLIMNPDRINAFSETTEIFEHVAKDVNKALRYAQNYSNYVWRESDLILAIKDKGREKRRPMKQLWNKILEKSSLAAALRDLFVSISNNDIANIRFLSNPPVRLSVQIPRPYSLRVPPDYDEEAIPGVRISSANCFDDQDGDDSSVLNKHFALLLLDDEEKIMSEVQADGGELATPLLEYLKIVRPTSSFLQTAQAHSISLSDIRILAQHLIYYRRAIAIPPLHARDTYMVSPNCDNQQLPTATVAWSKAFPLAPPLTTFLANLAIPRPWKTFAPSKAHRPIYLNKLAWLIRHGWVTQLSTFAWAIVWPEIRYEVEYALEAKRVNSAHEEAVSDAIQEAQAEAATSASTFSPSSSTSPIDSGTLATSSEAFAEKARIQRLREKAKQDALLFAKKPQPVATNSPSMNNAPHILPLAPIIIKDPYRASHIESLYLEAISKRFKDEKVRKAWMKYVRYFDGKEALEGIALREGVRRKEAWGLVGQWEEYLLVARHW